MLDAGPRGLSKDGRPLRLANDPSSRTRLKIVAREVTIPPRIQAMLDAAKKKKEREEESEG